MQMRATHTQRHTHALTHAKAERTGAYACERTPASRRRRCAVDDILWCVLRYRNTQNVSNNAIRFACFLSSASCSAFSLPSSGCFPRVLLLSPILSVVPRFLIENRVALRKLQSCPESIDHRESDLKFIPFDSRRDFNPNVDSKRSPNRTELPGISQRM